jgi:hypothetical protein
LTGQFLSLSGSVHRIDMPDYAGYIFECRACGHNTIHRIDVPLAEVVPTGLPQQELYMWIIRIHAPREYKKLMEIEALMTAQSMAEVKAALFEVPKPVPVEPEQPFWSEKIAA